MYTVSTHGCPADFLARAEAWLLVREDVHNLILSLAYARATEGVDHSSDFYATVESEGEILGCAMRTHPHKVLLTDMPTDVGTPLAAALSERYQEIPAVLGPPDAAESLAIAWVTLHGGGWRPGLDQRLYRLTSVTMPTGVSGALRLATVDDIDLGAAWGEGFARDVGHQFSTSRESVTDWIEKEALYIWEDESEPVSMALARAGTPKGARVGFVYTPPAKRRNGYASACVAEVSQRMLDTGLDFCVLYTDLSNPTSNAIYQQMGYEPIADVRDFDLVAEDVAP